MTSQIEEKKAAVETSAEQVGEIQDEQVEIKTPDILNNDYRYIRLLGEGANGRTWLAKDRRTALEVAVKELKFVEEFKAYELFQREAEVLQAVRVEGVPRFIKSVSAPDMTSYIVQEYIPYPSLENRIEKGEIFSEDEVYNILELTSRILFALQTQYVPAIIHRDIKPGNILYCPETQTEDAKVWLIDFGAVDNAHKQSSGSTIAGTFGYMSPEQLQGEVSPRSDFYSLGATALHLLTGVFPYEIPVELFQMKFHPVIEEKAPNTTKPMVDFLDTLLASNAENRPQDIKELRMLLDEARKASKRYHEIDFTYDPSLDNDWLASIGRNMEARGQRIVQNRADLDKDLLTRIGRKIEARGQSIVQSQAEKGKGLRTRIGKKMEARGQSIVQSRAEVDDALSTRIGKKIEARGQTIVQNREAVMRRRYEIRIQRQIEEIERRIAEEKRRREEEEKALQLEREKKGIICTCEVRRVSVAGKLAVNGGVDPAFRIYGGSEIELPEAETNLDVSILEGLFTHEGNWYAAYAYIGIELSESNVKCTVDVPEGVKVSENTFDVFFIPDKMNISLVKEKDIWLSEEVYTKFTGHKPLSRMTEAERLEFLHPVQVHTVHDNEKDRKRKEMMEEAKRRRLERIRNNSSSSSNGGSQEAAGSYYDRLQRLNEMNNKNRGY